MKSTIECKRRTSPTGLAWWSSHHHLFLFVYNMFLMLLMLENYCLLRTEAVEVIQVCPIFYYTLYTDQTTFTLETGLARFDKEGQEYLHSKIESANVDVTVLNYTSTFTPTDMEPCPSQPWTHIPRPDLLIECSQVSSVICVDVTNVQDRIDEGLVTRLVLVHVRNFVNTFNEKLNNRIFVEYQYPIPVKASIVLQFQGANEPLTMTEQEQLKQELMINLGRILTEQGYDLVSIVIVFQTALVVVESPTTNRRQLQEQDQQQQQQRRIKEQIIAFDDLSNNQEVTGTQVELLVTANCIAGDKCNPDDFQEAATQSTTSQDYWKQDLLTNLKEQLIITNVDSVDVSTTNQGILNLNVTSVLEALTRDLPIFQSEPQPIEEEPIPVWIWPLLGVVILILGVAILVTFWAVRRRNEQCFIQNQFDQHDAAFVTAAAAAADPNLCGEGAGGAKGGGGGPTYDDGNRASAMAYRHNNNNNTSRTSGGGGESTQSSSNSVTAATTSGQSQDSAAMIAAPEATMAAAAFVSPPPPPSSSSSVHDIPPSHNNNNSDGVAMATAPMEEGTNNDNNNVQGTTPLPPPVPYTVVIE